MFCPKCGKHVYETDNFCRYCGNNLKEEAKEEIAEAVEKITQPEEPKQQIEQEKKSFYEGEELVLYIAKKHFMAMFWPVFLTPLFLFYFWNIFLNTHSFFSWIVTISILALIIYPIARYNSDKIIITTKSFHIKIGVLNPAEIEIPLEKVDIIDVSQSSMGRALDYGNVSFCSNGEKFDYTYIQSPEELQYIIDDPERFVKEALEEE